MARQDKDKGRGRIAEAAKDLAAYAEPTDKIDVVKVTLLAMPTTTPLPIAVPATAAPISANACAGPKPSTATTAPASVAKFRPRGTTVDVRLDDGREHACHAHGAENAYEDSTPLVIGDHVPVDESTEPPVINDLLPRANALVRADSHNKALAHASPPTLITWSLSLP